MAEGGERGGVGNSGGRWCLISGRCRWGDSIGGVPVVIVCWMSEGDSDTSDGRGAPSAHSELCGVVVLVGEGALL